MDAPQTAAAHPPSAIRYLAVWIALLALTAVTYLVARVDLGGHWNLAAALVIAITKASLVVLFFMHLWDGRGTNRLVFAVSMFFVLLLLGGALGDVVDRFRLALPPEATGLEAPTQAPPEPGPSLGGQNEPPPR